MTKIDKHINELLFDHDCVIVPELGGFLASYAHARIHPTQHTFTPPSKKIAFNIFLKQNDGLLANHISKSERLSYNDAIKQIEQFVSGCNGELSEGKKIIIERVGTLYYDVEKNLQFEPFRHMNYLLDSFGLSTVQSLPVKHSKFDERVQKQLKEFTGTRPSVRKEKKPVVLSKNGKQKILNSLILGGALLWLSFNIYIITPDNFSMSSFNPSSKKKIENVIPSVKSNVTIAKPEAVQPIKAETTFTASAIPLAETTTVVSPENKSSEKSLPDVSNKSVRQVGLSKEKFFIVAGAFKSDANAEMFLGAVKQQGFSAARVINSDNEMKYVCYEGFATRDEALTELARLKALNKEGWIYPH